MCRHLAYVGPPLALGALVTDPPHSLVHQSYAPLDMRGGGTVSVDGFGVGWYRASGETARYRRAVPIWQDGFLSDLCAHTASTGVLAAVRGASAGMGSAETACAPFTDGTWLFSLNGVVAGWPASLAERAAELPVTDLMTLDAPTDAAVVWAWLSRQLTDGRDPATALRSLIGGLTVSAPGSRMTCLLTDGRTVWATTWVHSLWWRRFGAGAVLASEPLDPDPSWTEVPDAHLVVADAAGVRLSPLTTTEATLTP